MPPINRYFIGYYTETSERIGFGNTMVDVDFIITENQHLRFLENYVKRTAKKEGKELLVVTVVSFQKVGKVSEDVPDPISLSVPDIKMLKRKFGI